MRSLVQKWTQVLVAVLLQHDFQHLFARFGLAPLAASDALRIVLAVRDALALVVCGGQETAQSEGGALRGGVTGVDEPGARVRALRADGVGAQQSVAAVLALGGVGQRHWCRPVVLL